MKFYFVLVGIISLFFVLLGVKEIFNKKLKENFCVICAAVSLTWITLLIFNILYGFQDKTLLGILMGHTSLGLFYIIDKHSKRNFKIFKLPLLLTFISIIYFVLEGFEKNSLIILGILWGIISLIYIFKDSKTKSVVNKLIECCKNF